MYTDDPSQLDPTLDPTTGLPKTSATSPTIGITDPTVRATTAPAPTPLFAGGLTPTTPYTDNKTPRLYTGADGNTYTDDPNPNSVSGFILQPGNKAADAGKKGDATPDYGTDPGILAQIAKWADMPGADPSLKNDPNYWLKAIKDKGGLNAGNLQYWQDAGVGPSAFFNNPNREGGGQNTPPPITPPNTGGTGQPPANQQDSDSLFNFLMQKAHQSAQVDPNDPMIRSQSDNYSANLTRTGRQYLSELAERKGSGGNIGAESRMVAEKNAQAGADHEGQLVQHESDQRRQEIEQALSTGAQFLTDQQRMSLQKELATIDNNMKLYQTKIQDRQFGQRLGQDQSQFGSTMSQREREFNDNLRQRAYEYDTSDEYRRSPYAQRPA